MEQEGHFLLKNTAIKKIYTFLIKLHGTDKASFELLGELWNNPLTINQLISANTETIQCVASY